MFRQLIFMLTIALTSLNVVADPPVTDAAYQWNNNVKIDFIYSYEASGRHIHVRLDNGSWCYAKLEDEILIASLFAMRAQSATGQLVCKINPGGKVDGQDSRHIHRIRY